MKKFLIALLILPLFLTCKHDDVGFTIIREYGPGTFTTIYGASKYFAAKKDGAYVIRDIYAKVSDTVAYMNSKDNVLVYGHCWSTNRSKIRVTDSMATRFTAAGAVDSVQFPLNDYVTTVPNNVISSVMTKLKANTKYYYRSYVITGSKDGDGTKTDTAYNPVVSTFNTLRTTDKWTQCTDFTDQFKGGISFVYQNKLYVGLGDNAFMPTNVIYKYDPKTDIWTQATTFSGGGIADAVAFVITGVNENGTILDYVYVGTGYKKSLNGTQSLFGDFYRWNFDESQSWQQMVNLSTYPGGGRKNAVAFTIGTKAYVGLGQNLTVGVFNDFYQFDPQTRDSDHPQGTWIKMSNLPPAAGLAKAVSFVLEGVGFVTTGIDQNNTYQKSLWMYLPPSGSSITGAWVQRASFPGTKRIDATGFAIENFGYVGTGFDGTTLLNDFWMYNPYLNTWTPKAPFLGTPRREAVGAGLDFGKDLNGNEEYRGYLGTGLTGDPITPYTGTFYYYQP